MKIIGTSNFDLDNVDDILIADHLNEYYGELILKFLRNKMTENNTYYPILVDNDYKLYKFEP